MQNSDSKPQLPIIEQVDKVPDQQCLEKKQPLNTGKEIQNAELNYIKLSQQPRMRNVLYNLSIGIQQKLAVTLKGIQIANIINTISHDLFMDELELAGFKIGVQQSFSQLENPFIVENSSHYIHRVSTYQYEDRNLYDRIFLYLVLVGFTVKKQMNQDKSSLIDDISKKLETRITKFTELHKKMSQLPIFSMIAISHQRINQAYKQLQIVKYDYRFLVNKILDNNSGYNKQSNTTTRKNGNKKNCQTKRDSEVSD